MLFGGVGGGGRQVGHENARAALVSPLGHLELEEGGADALYDLDVMLAHERYLRVGDEEVVAHEALESAARVGQQVLALAVLEHVGETLEHAEELHVLALRGQLVDPVEQLAIEARHRLDLHVYARHELGQEEGARVLTLVRGE